MGIHAEHPGYEPGVVARDMIKRPTKLEANYFQNSRAFTLGEFLQALVGDSRFGQITHISFSRERTGLVEEIAQAWCHLI